jgi:signal transduction histidine kinase
MDRIAEHVLRALTNQLEATSSSVWLRNAATGLMDFEFALEEEMLKSKSDPLLASISPSLPIDAIQAWPEAFDSGKPVVLLDIRDGPDFPWRSHVLRQGIITILVVPMFVAGEPSGAIGLRFNQRRVFHAGEMALAQALASQAMLAMQLTRLSEKNRQSAVMEERNRMAREVHDTLAQGFTGIVVQLEAAEEAMSQDQKPKASSHLERAGELARESLQEARRSVQALRPRALEANSLATALAELMAKMTSDTLVEAKLSVDGEARELPSEWENNLLRIGQEVLTNALRHARPTEFQAQLSFTPEGFGLRLRDNGCGFDPTERHEGFGLQGIRERTEKMGGKFSILSTKGAGTSVSILLSTKVTLPD